ncbi:unnamed protein product [Closterium sp. NIES-64]|nr:unnamed protein product [Closterium sp. NIES-64]
MMQIMPLLVADESALKSGEAGELHALQVKAFWLFAAIKTREPVLTKKYRTMRIGGMSDPVYDEYIAALGDEMKGMANEFMALGLATNSVQVK